LNQLSVISYQLSVQELIY